MTPPAAEIKANRPAPEMPPFVTMFPLLDELLGQRVVVRPWQIEDAEALYRTVTTSRDHLLRSESWARAYTSIDYTRDVIIRSHAQRLLREEEFAFGIWHAESIELLGGTELQIRSWPARVFEIGYWLSTSAEGHGYASEAVRLLTDAAFATYDASRVEIRCDARNTRSADVARRLGFIEEARLRSHMVGADGRLRDTLVFALIASDPRWPS